MYHACGKKVHIRIVFTLRHVHTQVTPMRALNADDKQCTNVFANVYMCKAVCLVWLHVIVCIVHMSACMCREVLVD